MINIIIVLLLAFNILVTVPMRYVQGRTDGIKFCVEHPTSCKQEYNGVKYQEIKEKWDTSQW